MSIREIVRRQYNGVGLRDWRNIPVYAHVMGKPLCVFKKYVNRRDADIINRFA